jgi:coenzyme F420 hydrogenase subunit beta
MAKDSIRNIVENELCSGCGTCSALCPSHGIELEIDGNRGVYYPKIITEKCNDCGLCYEICPGRGVDFNKLCLNIFGSLPNNSLIGNTVNCWVGHSTNKSIRANSSSGGLITQLLIHLLNEGTINGALVTSMRTDKPLEAYSFIAKNETELIQASKSKYCPVPVNLSLKEIIDSKEGQKYAVVGLPCHIQGIRKAEQKNIRLRERIKLHLGILCNHTPNFWGTKLLVNKLGFNEREILKINYRGNGWPGYFHILTKHGIKNLDYRRSWNFFGSQFFYPKRCLLCNDFTCELADISFGDAWRICTDRNDNQGQSLIISRNDFGNQLIKNMASRRIIDIEKIDSNHAINSQKGMIYFKQKNIEVYKNILTNVPFYNNNNTHNKITFLDYLLAIFPYMCSSVSKNSNMRKILRHIPLCIFSYYAISYSFISGWRAKKEFDMYKKTIIQK